MKRIPGGNSAGYRALVVDDEVPLASVVASYLEREHFEVSVAHNGHDALAMAREFDPDVVVLDLALPGIDGLEACRQLRTFSDAYVVMLTARDTEMDTVIGLSVGADDYVTKPFSPRELVARIRAMLRRPRTVAATEAGAAPDQPPPRVFGALRIDIAGREVFIDDEPIMLTRTEFDVLAALSARPGVVFSRRQLLDAVWAESWVGNEHLVDVHIGHSASQAGRRSGGSALCDHGARRRIPDGEREVSRSRRPGIGARLLLAQTLVLVAGAATAWIVAAIVGPPLFREHLHRAGVPAMSSEQMHAEEAYTYATAISIGVALAVSALAALVVTWYFSRRVQRSVAEVSSAAAAVADGRYDSRVSPPQLGDDFDSLAQAFNQMASRLESVEATRRRLFGDLAHEIRTPVSVLEAYMEAVEDGVKTLDRETITMLRDQTRRLVRFSEDVAALAQAEESQASITPTSVAPGHSDRDGSDRGGGPLRRQGRDTDFPR